MHKKKKKKLEMKHGYESGLFETQHRTRNIRAATPAGLNCEDRLSGLTLLAYALVCVNVAIAVRAGVCYILQVVNQARNQAASKVTPHKEAEEAEK